jgi:hypothetical protein
LHYFLKTNAKKAQGLVDSDLHLVLALLVVVALALLVAVLSVLLLVVALALLVAVLSVLLLAAALVLPLVAVPSVLLLASLEKLKHFQVAVLLADLSLVAVLLVEYFLVADHMMVKAV